MKPMWTIGSSVTYPDCLLLSLKSGESKQANIGISLPGTGERPVAPVYEDGRKTVTLKGDGIAAEFQGLVEAYIERTYPRRDG